MNAIRLDSGDLAYLSIQARQMLDEAGLDYVKIVASNDLDENTIFNLKAQGARIDTWGVGTQLITASDQPSLGGVYKLVEREVNGEMLPTLKISANPEKVSTPGKKRFSDHRSEAWQSDCRLYLLSGEEQPLQGGPLKLFNPLHPYLKKTVTRYEAVNMLEPIFVNGRKVYELPTLDEIRAYHKEQLNLFWPEYQRKLNPEIYRVNISPAAWNMKQKLIAEHVKSNEE